MRWFFAFFLFVLGAVCLTKAAAAEPWQVVPRCGAQTLVAGDGVGGFIDTTGLVCVSGSGGGYPSGATAITASNTGTTAATTATLAGTSGKTTYICSYSIRANATAAATVTDTVTGVITATMSSILWVAPLASGLGVDEQIFTPCVPASGTNQAIAVVSGTPGSGGTVSVHATGYQQ